MAQRTARCKIFLLPEDRVRLAEELRANLEPHVSYVGLAWEQEIRRRVAEVERVLVELIPTTLTPD